MGKGDILGSDNVSGKNNIFAQIKIEEKIEKS
jgi:hypothetical protein